MGAAKGTLPHSCGRELEVLVTLAGAPLVLDPTPIRDDPEFLPESWNGTTGAARRLARRLLKYAHVRDVDVRVIVAPGARALVRSVEIGRVTLVVGESWSRARIVAELARLAGTLFSERFGPSAQGLPGWKVAVYLGLGELLLADSRGLGLDDAEISARMACRDLSRGGPDAMPQAFGLPAAELPVLVAYAAKRASVGTSVDDSEWIADVTDEVLADEQAVLGKRLAVRGAERVLRVVRTRARLGAAIGLGVGCVVSGAILLWVVPVTLALLLSVGAVGLSGFVGHAIGHRVRDDCCSNELCRGWLPVGMDRCLHCGGTIEGVVDRYGDLWDGPLSEPPARDSLIRSVSGRAGAPR